MLVKYWLADAQQQLKKAGVESARLDALLMLEALLGKERSSIQAHDDDNLTQEQLTQLDKLLQERLKRIPLAYVLGYREFYGLQLAVSEHVLVPRPESELFVTYIAAHLPEGATLLELGTGSGAISLGVKHERPDISITATDISQDALTVARKNARSLGLDINFLESNLFEAVNGKFDMVAANLPYVPITARRQKEITYEPDIALYGGEDGLDHYRLFFAGVENHTNQAIIEFSPTQFAALRTEYAKFTFTPLSEYVYLVDI